MLNMVKKLAKAIKGVTRPHNAKSAVSYCKVPAKVLVMPNREDLTARMIQTLQTTVDAKLQAFLEAVEAYPVHDYDVDEFPQPEGANLIHAAAALGFDIDGRWAREYAALCAAIEYHQQQGDEITIELVADVVEAINDNEYVFFMGVHDDEDLGSAILDEFREDRRSWGYGWLIACVDWERLGEDWRNETGGSYTSRGYFQYGQLEF